jgi:hypothetical protein
MHLRNLLAVSVALVAVAGCTVAGKVEEEIADLQKRLVSGDSALPKEKNRGGVRQSDAPILGTRVVRPTLGSPLPGGADAKKFAWKSDTYVTLPDVAAYIAETTGIPVKVNDRRVGVGAASGAAPTDMVVNAANAASAFQAAMGGAGLAPRSFPGVMQPAYEGTLAGFLQSLEPRFDVTVSYRDGAIVFDAYQVLTCDVPAPPTKSTINSDVSGATTGKADGPSGGTAAQSSKTESVLDTFAEVRGYLQKIVGTTDVFEVSPSLRRFVVVGGSETTRRARQYCQQLNDFLSTRIAVEATIVEVTIGEGDDYGLDLDPVWRGSNIAFSGFGVAPQIANSSGSTAVRVLSAIDGGKNQHWSASQAFIKAAANDGRLANTRHAVAVLQNGRAHTLNLTVRQDYIRNVNSSPGSVTSGATTGTQTDTINYGYSMQLTAHSSGADEIQIHGSISVSDLAAQVEKTAGRDQIVQLLTVPQRGFDLDVPLGNGETLVMSGNENVRARRDRTGIISPAFFLPGGADKASYETTRVVLFLSAWRLSGPRRQPAGVSE